MNDVNNPRIIKRYGNRKLYDTAWSRYVTLDDIAEMIREGEQVLVVDNQTQEDLTSVTLAQIILEQEKRKARTPLDVLREIVRQPGLNLGEFLKTRVAEPVVHLREGAEQRVEELRRKSETTREEVLSTMKSWIEQQQTSIENLQRKAETRALEGKAFAKDELLELRREFSDLQSRLREIETRLSGVVTRSTAFIAGHEVNGRDKTQRPD